MKKPPRSIREAEDPRRPHLLHADWGRDGDGTVAAMRFWRTSDGVVLQDIRANAAVRGSEMLRWLAGFGRPVTVIEVIPQAEGFWRRMLGEGLISEWQAATGRAHPLEGDALPWIDAVSRPASRIRNLRRRVSGQGSGDGKGEAMGNATQQQRDAIAGPPPDGYGGILHSDGPERPEWIDPQEIVARHLPMGLSERKAAFVTTWDHPFRLRADHPRYTEA